MVTFCPSTMPYSAKPLRKASTKCALSLADRALRNPMAGLFEGCAFATSGQAAEPAITLMTSRRLIAAFRGFRQVILQARATRLEAADHVRFGSLTDICSATGHVRFAPNSDRKSGLPQNGHVRFTPKSGHVHRNSSCLLWANSGHHFEVEPCGFDSDPDL